MPLTPVQRRFLDSGPARPWHFDQWMMLELAASPDPAALGVALAALTGHHDALRMRFTRDADGWRQYNPPTGSAGALDVRDLTSVTQDRQRDVINEVAARVHSSFDLTTGRLLRAVLFERGRGRRPVLLLAAHHLVVDGVSWRILLDDLETAYQHATTGAAVDLGRKTTAFRDWALRLDDRARDGGFDDELAHWARLTGGSGTAVPADGHGPNTTASTRSITRSLPSRRTLALLHEVPGAYRTQINDILLTALGSVLRRWAGRDRVLIDLEGHGREEGVIKGTDLSRTVGWFTAIFPVVLDMPSGGWGQALKSVKEQLRAIPRRGLGYGALRYLADRAGLACQPAVSFNYLGQLDRAVPVGGIISAVEHGLDAGLSSDTPRTHQLEVVGRIENQRLQVTWTYSVNLHHHETIAALANRMIQALDEIIAHCSTPGSGGRTPSDFPLARLDQAAIDELAGSGRDVEDIYPLTPMQAGMAFHGISQAGQGVYVEQVTFILDGVADPGALAAAWQRVTDRTPILRTAIAWDNDCAPVQVVHHRAPLPVTHLDWIGHGEAARRDALSKFLDDDRAVGLDLAVPPLMRLAIARLSATEVHVIWTFHHVLLDGWSVFHVLTDVFAAHAAPADGRSPSPSARPPFRGYLQWLASQDPAGVRNLLARRPRRLRLPDPPPLRSAAGAPARRAVGPMAFPSRGLGAPARVCSAARPHGQQPDAGCLGAAAVPVYRPARPGLWRHGLRPPGRPSARR